MTGLGQIGPIWLDVTRLLSRIGRGAMTGIDRVELAYLDHLIAVGGAETRFFCKTTRGFLVLGRDGAVTLSALAHGTAKPGSADLWSRISGRGDRARHRAEATLRPLAVDRCLPPGLPRMLARQTRRPVTYLNTGHSNLSVRVLSGFAGQGARIATLIHDLIPLTHPETVAPEMPARFATRIDTVRRYGDVVICNSDATRQGLARHWAGPGTKPRLITAHLGVDPVGHRPDHPRDLRAYVMLGTIEPRKNHALMLDVWEALARDLPPDQLPHLHIIGPRGWRVDDLLQRLDTHPLINSAIFEHGPLPENAVVARLAAARALLFPSIVEGFGYPPLEALQLETLPITSDLPVLRETMGDAAVYVPENDAYSWTETIKKHVDGSLRVPVLTSAQIPRWRDHFETVARGLGSS
jgi:glycosyltransferase involved in cell wall biosynthesis